MPLPSGNPWLEARRAEARDRRRQEQAGDRRHKDPSRKRAWKAVERARAAGLLTPEPCQVNAPGCVQEPVQWHHDSYLPGHELEGRWACPVCHGRLSAQARRQAEAARRRPAPAEGPAVITIPAAPPP